MRRERVRILGFLIYLSAFLLSGNLFAQEIENQLQFRSSVAFSKKISTKFKVEVGPELRWRHLEGFERFQLNSQLEYNLIKYIDLFAGYRMVGDKTEEINYYHRYQFGAKGEVKLSKFKPSIRIMYTNYADDPEINEEKEYLRYKMSLEYNIPKCKLTPEIAFEGFHQLAEGSIYKYRYKVGLDYKFSKKIKLSAGYKLDYFMGEYKNRHIVDIGLKAKF